MPMVPNHQKDPRRVLGGEEVEQAAFVAVAEEVVVAVAPEPVAIDEAPNTSEGWALQQHGDSRNRRRHLHRLPRLYE